MRKTVFVGAMLALSAWAQAASADCGPLMMIASVDMQIGNDGRVYVPVKIAGADKTLLVDTGGFFTEVTEDAVAELKLPTRHSRMELIGISGDTTDLVARASLWLGNLHADNVDFMVMPSVHQVADNVSAVGLLAPNLLRSYDVDLDFGAKKFNLLSQDHCDGKVVYWQAAAVSVVPMDIDTSGHINVPVELDGRKLTAILDTGASTTAVNLDVAKSTFDVTPGDADTPQVGHFPGNAAAKVYSHRFKTLSFEGVTIGNPTLSLIPDMLHNKLSDPHDTVSGDTHIKSRSVKAKLDDMIVGMDVLHRLHVYVAYKEKKLYITPATAPAAAPAEAVKP